MFDLDTELSYLKLLQHCEMMGLLIENKGKMTKEEALQKIKELETYINMKAKPETYEDICENLDRMDHSLCLESTRQGLKLIAINKLMNVAKYLNDGWVWSEFGFHIGGNLRPFRTTAHSGRVMFKSRDLVLEAIQILGEETIKLALTQDY